MIPAEVIYKFANDVLDDYNNHCPALAPFLEGFTDM